MTEHVSDSHTYQNASQNSHVKVPWLVCHNSVRIPMVAGGLPITLQHIQVTISKHKFLNMLNVNC